MKKVIISFFVLFSIIVFSVHSESASANRWSAYRDALRHDGNVARYYTFEDVRDSKSSVPDMKGTGADLVFRPFTRGSEEIDDLKVIEGRFEGKTAVRLDRGWYEGPAFDMEQGQFSLSCWFRRQGPGSLQSNSMVDEGGIVSVSGWERGWSIYTVYDSHNTLRFCIGQPDGSVNVMSDITIPDNTWHHLVVTWNGRDMIIYLNGMLVGRRAFSGSYIPSREGDVLRLGYAGKGTGSVLLDIDEVAIYETALTHEQVRGLGDLMANPALEIFAAADRLIEKGDYDGARKEYEKIKGLQSIEFARELALFNIADSYVIQGDYANAHNIYAQIFSLPGLSANYRIYGLFRQAEAYVKQGDYRSARNVYSEITLKEEVSEHHLFKARIYAGDTYRAERRYEDAREIYKELLKKQNASSYPHENYRLELIDRLENIDGLPDGQKEFSLRQKRAARVNSPGHAIYVCLNGDDGGAGTKENPFNTFSRAREEVRRIKEAGMPEGGVAVYIRGGKYFLSESISFDNDDSGKPGSPVVYRNYPGEEVRLIGGVQLNNFTPLSEPDIIRRLPEESRGNIWVSDLREAGIKDYGQLRTRGHSGGWQQLGAMELFFNNRPMTLARWPNEGWLFTELVTPGGDGGSGFTVFQRGRFRYRSDRTERWAEESDIWIAGYVVAPWDKMHYQVINIDTEENIINLGPDVRHHPATNLYDSPVREDKPYFFYNILSELSAPGEFYVDREEGKLYFYPPDKMEDSELIVSTLGAPIVEFNDASNIILFGMTLECTWDNAVEMKGGFDNLIAGSTIRNAGRYAVNIAGGMRHGVVGCDIYDTGEGGVFVSGGDLKNLVPSGHFVENNHIYRFNRFCGGYRPAVGVMGIGDRVSHNLISDSSHHAIYFDRNNHIIEFNEIYDVVHEARDAGAIYLYGEPRYLMNRGHILRYNFIHHITHHSSVVPYPRAGMNAIYIDAVNAGITMTGNVFHRCTGSTIFTHGPDTRVENNIFSENILGISQGNRSGLLRMRQRVQRLEDDVLGFLNHNQPPWVTRYPQLRHMKRVMEEDLAHSFRNPGWPRDIYIERNISLGGQFLRMPSEELYEGNTVRNNIEGYDPMFFDSANLDFRIRPGSPVYGITGFKPIPFEEIGLYDDPLRASWPVKRLEAGKYYKIEKMEIIPEASIAFDTLPFENEPVVYHVRRITDSIKIDGKLEKEEWSGLDRRHAFIMDKLLPDGRPLGVQSYVWVLYDDEYLYIGVENKDMKNDGSGDLSSVFNEISIEGLHSRHTWWWHKGIDTGPVYILSGYSDGSFRIMDNFRMPGRLIEYINENIEYKAVMLEEESYHWTAEWKIPLALLNPGSAELEKLRFNIGGPRRRGWIAWVPTGASLWRIDNAGTLEFGE